MAPGDSWESVLEQVFSGGAAHSHRGLVCRCGLHAGHDILVVGFTESPDEASGGGIAVYMSQAFQAMLAVSRPRCLVVDLTGLRDTGRDSVVASLVETSCRARNASILLVLPEKATMRSLLEVFGTEKLFTSRYRGPGGYIAPDLDTALRRAHAVVSGLAYMEHPGILCFRQSLLQYAQSGGSASLFRYLETQRAFIEGWNSSPGVKPLDLAIVEGIPDFVRWLIAAGVRPHEGALALAVDFRRHQIVRLLLEAGAEVNLAHEGKTALFRAAAHGDNEMVRTLLAFGADVFQTGYKGPKPFQIALEHGYSAVGALLQGRTRPFIGRLTPQQEARRGPCWGKWHALALSCEPADFARAEAAAGKCYLAAGLPLPQRCVFASDPVEVAHEVTAVVSKMKDSLMQLLEVREALVAQGVWQIRRHVDDSIWNDVETAASQMISELDAYFPRVEASRFARDFFTFTWQQLVTVDCITAATGLARPERLGGHFELAQHCGLWFFLGDVAILQDRPCELHRNPAGLHCDGGPAARYRSGFRIWALHGVAVPQWLAEQRAAEIEPRRLLEIDDDVDVRREFVRKVGIERVCHSLGAKCVDKAGDYELLLLDLGDGERRPYLKMLDPSLGTWHVQGVAPWCESVAEALAWRNETDQPPENLT